MNKYLNYYKKLFNNNFQIIHKTLSKDNKDYFYLSYNVQMVNKDILNYTIIPILNDLINSNEFDLLNSSLLEIEEFNKYNIKEIESKIYSGNLLIYSFKLDKMYSLNLAYFNIRTPSLDSNDIVYSGTKDNLIESLDINLSLIYRRIKSNDLINEVITVGELTKTRISILYLNNKIDNNILNVLINKLKKLKIESLTSVSDLNTKIFDKPKLVPLTTYTSKVDLLELALLNNKIVLLIDGIPEGIVLPMSLFNFASFNDAINEGVIITLFNKVFSFLGLFLSLFLLGLYTSIILYEPDLIPYNILINIYNSYKGIAVSGELELLIAYTFFLIFFHAGNKSLNGLSSSILIIGSLLIGQVAVSSGFISQITLIIVAISIYSCFIISNNISLNISFLFLQFINFVSSLIFGFLGYLVSILLIIIYLNSLESFEVPYLYPFTNLNFNKIKESFLSSNFIKRKENKKWRK